jgi:hypothetical protein
MNDQVGTDMNTDCRSAGTRLFNGLGVKELVWTLYPRLFALHKMDEMVPPRQKDEGMLTFFLI